MEQKLNGNKILGANLKLLRLNAGFGVSELARHMQLQGCDITRECIVKIEAGKHNVSMQQLLAFKTAFEVSYDEIFSFLEED